ncbi:hypothetical protein DRN73_03100, partial [Candidatus Pacearchaeota archaeon]
MRIKNKAQITIFIIIAILFVFLIGIIFVLRNAMNPETTISAETEPELFIKSCIQDSFQNTLNKLEEQGGFLKQENKALGNISYLCYSIDGKCVNQHPLLLKEISKELEENLSNKINECFENLKESLQKKAYSVEINSRKMSVEINPNKISVNLNKTLVIKKADFVKNFDSLKIEFKSSLYELISIAQDIVNSEARNCDFDFIEYM